MKVSTILAASFASFAAAAKFTNSEFDVTPGEPFTLTWDDANGPVEIVLRSGDPANLDTVGTLGTGLSGGSFTVTLDPEELASGNYAFMIVDSDGENYSELFPFQGNAAATQSGSTTGSATITATSSGTTSATASSTETETDSETTSATRTTSASRTSATSDTEETEVPGAAPAVSSPLALILVTIAAMFYFN